MLGGNQQNRQKVQKRPVRCFIKLISNYPGRSVKFFRFFGAPYILINGAVINTREHANDVKFEKWDKTLQLNLSTPFILSKLFEILEDLNKNRDKLLTIKNKMNDTPEEIAKFWKFIRSKIYQIKEKNLQLAIKDDLDNRINKLSKNLLTFFF